MRRFRRSVRIALDLGILAAALAVFAFTKTTPAWATESMVRLFCFSGGRSNDIMARFLSKLHPPMTITAPDGVLPPLKGGESDKIAAALREKGCFVYEQRVPESICDRLLQFALSHPAVVRLQDGEMRQKVDAVYDPSNPRGIRYDFKEEDLINHPDIQALMADPAIIAVAQTYLGTEPVADVVTMWWHTAFSDQPDAEAAQFYHFDMDRIKWVKFFIYLTDVSSESGPHYFVTGSHRTGGIPYDLLSKGYVRLLDEEVEAHFPPENFVEFLGPRGTIIAEDTRGLHKWQHVRRGHRLMLQIQFSSSRFGPPYPRVSFEAIKDHHLAEMATTHPRIYAAYVAEKLGQQTSAQ